MTLSRDDEEAIVLYHDICHILARLDMVSVPVLEALKLRMTTEMPRADEADQYALSIMIGLVTVYIVDNEELVETDGMGNPLDGGPPPKLTRKINERRPIARRKL